MTIDGFSLDQTLPFHGFSGVAADRFYGKVERLMKLLRIQVDCVDKLPEGRALIVANHTFGWDVVFPMCTAYRATGHPVWALGEHLWWRVPILRRIAARVGTVDGTPENVDLLLSNDQKVIVLPGGIREATKPRELRYRLMWGHRYGFVRAAIRNQAPIVPLAAIGADDFFDFIGNPYARGRKWAASLGIPIPLPARFLPIPHVVPMRFVFGDPIPVPDDPAIADDEVAVRRLRHEVEGAIHELLEIELARRVGVDLT
jgi:1-acyl-sn-glycerol-3-phosphate acyltransferase